MFLRTFYIKMIKSNFILSMLIKLRSTNMLSPPLTYGGMRGPLTALPGDAFPGTLWHSSKIDR